MSKGTILIQTEKGVVDLTPHVKRFVYKNSLFTGAARWYLKFSTPIWDYWSDILIGKTLLLNMKVSHVRNDYTTETPWLALVVDSSYGEVKGVNLTGEVTGGGKELEMMEEEKRRAFPNMSASQLIQRIATEYQLVATLGASMGSTTWYQANQTDWEMLQEAMDYYVAASDQRGDTFLNIEGLRLAVKPINFAAPSVRKYTLNDVQQDDRVDGFSFRYYGGQVDRMGGTVVEVRGFDPSTGLAVNSTVDPLTSGQPALANRLPKSFSNKKKVIIDPFTTPVFIRARALRAQGRFAGLYYGMALDVVNDLGVKLRDMVEITLKDRAGKGSKFEGRYGVHEYVVDYSPKKTITTLLAYRKEAYIGSIPAVGANVSQSVGVDKQKTQASGRFTTRLTAVPVGL